MKYTRERSSLAPITPGASQASSLAGSGSAASAASTSNRYRQPSLVKSAAEPSAAAVQKRAAAPETASETGSVVCPSMRT